MGLETGLPTTMAEYVDRSMACQAEGLKLGVEHYRRRQPSCSGTLVWQFNDVWPGLSWSVLDHDLVGKAGYWFLQRAYAPVVATFRRDGERVELWVTSSGQVGVDLDLDVGLGTLERGAHRRAAGRDGAAVLLARRLDRDDDGRGPALHGHRRCRGGARQPAVPRRAAGPPPHRHGRRTGAAHRPADRRGGPHRAAATATSAGSRPTCRASASAPTTSTSPTAPGPSSR